MYDRNTGLTWQQTPDVTGDGLINTNDKLSWAAAQLRPAALNAANYGGYSDWRLPNAKELQSILDYARSPDTSGSAAIDPVFVCTRITNENNQVDYPWYWSGTTHAAYSGSGSAGAYVCFGRGLGYMNSAWVDVHGAGCQRSDPKGGSLSNYTFAVNGYYNSVAPQGDAIRIFNYVRLVRDYPPDADSIGDGIPDWWRAQYFGGTGMTTNSQSCASADLDGDGLTTLEEYLADTNPLTNASRLAVVSVGGATNGLRVAWTGGTAVTQFVEVCQVLAATGGTWVAFFTNAPPTPVTNVAVQTGALTGGFFRIKAGR